MEGLAFEAKDLLVAGEGKVGKILFQFEADGERVTFDPSMALIEGRCCLMTQIAKLQERFGPGWFW